MALPHARPVRRRYVEESGELRRLARRGCRSSCCTLHSQVAPGLRGARRACASRTIQVAGGRCRSRSPTPCGALQRRGLLETSRAPSRRASTATPQFVDRRRRARLGEGQGYDGRRRAARRPGIIGTGSRLGHGALALADAAERWPPRSAAASDARRAHVRGRSPRPHQRRLASRRRRSSTCALGGRRSCPDEPRRRAAGSEACAGLPLSHMGRGADEDPAFFRAAYAPQASLARRHAR